MLSERLWNRKTMFFSSSVQPINSLISESRLMRSTVQRNCRDSPRGIRTQPDVQPLSVHRRGVLKITVIQRINPLRIARMRAVFRAVDHDFRICQQLIQRCPIIRIAHGSSSTSQCIHSSALSQCTAKPAPLAQNTESASFSLSAPASYARRAMASSEL